MWFNTCCVGIREHDNVFHQEFLRDSAGLRATDFPSGQPFRFGHDFAHPPTLPKWPQLVQLRLDVEKVTSHSPSVAKTSGGTSGWKDGEWWAFEGVDFGEGWQSAVLRLASDAKEMNTDRSTRAVPRHRQATDPLVLEAEYHDGAAEHVRKQWTFVYNLGQQGWVRFNQVPLGEGYRRFRAVYGNDSLAPGRLEVRLDQPDGPLIGQVALPQTDHYRGSQVQIYSEAVAELSPTAAGTHDLFLVFPSGNFPTPPKPDSLVQLPRGDGRRDGPYSTVAFEYLRFEQYRGELPLQKNELKLELRAGSKDGPKLGEFYPQFTGGADTFQEYVARLEPMQGTQSLFLVVRSALAEPIGVLDGLRLEKGVDPWT